MRSAWECPIRPIARVAASPVLMEQLVGELRHARESRWAVGRRARALVRTAEQLQPGVAAPQVAGHKRPAGEWAGLLSALASLLGSRQFYDPTCPASTDQLTSWRVSTSGVDPSTGDRRCRPRTYSAGFDGNVSPDHCIGGGRVSGGRVNSPPAQPNGANAWECP